MRCSRARTGAGRSAERRGGRGGRLGRLGLRGGQGLDLPHRQPLGHDAAGDTLGIAQRQKGAGVAGGDLTRTQPVLHRRRQVEEAQRVGEVAAAFAEDLRQLPLGVGEVPHQALVARGFLDRVEVGPLDVLEDREFEGGAVVDLDDDHRHLVETGALGRAPAALARHDLEGPRHVGQRPHHDGLDETPRPDRTGELGQFLLAEMAAGVAGVRPQEFHRDLALAFVLRHRLRRIPEIADQGRESAPQPGPCDLLRHRLCP